MPSHSMHGCACAACEAARQPHQRASARRSQELDRAADHLRPFAHRHQTEAATRVACRREARAAILHFELHRPRGMKRSRTQACFAPECRATLFNASWSTR